MRRQSLVLRMVSLLVLAALVLAVMPVAAQDGLSDEEKAILDRFLAVNDLVDGFDSYVNTGVEKQVQNFSILSNGTALQTNATDISTESVTTIVRGDNPSASYVATITTVTNDVTSVVDGELRYVDGVMYAQAAYTEGTGEAVFPDGWTEIADPALPGAYEILDPQDVLDTLTNSQENPLDDPEFVASVISGVSSEPGEIDGVAGEFITLEIGTDQMFTLMSKMQEEFDPNSPEAQIFANFMGEGSAASISLFLDSDGNPVQLAAEFNIAITGVDVSEIDPNTPEGFTLDLTLEISSVETLSEINAAAPVTAPQ